MTALDHRERTIVGYGCVVVAAVAWGLLGVFTNELVDTGMSAGGIGTWRAVLGGACFVVQVGLTRPRPVQPIRRHASGLIAFSLIGVSLFFAALPLAIEAGGITVAYVLMYTAPAWVTVGAVVLLHERVDGMAVALLAATVFGAGLVSLAAADEFSSSAGGIVWGLVAGLSYASYYLLGRRLFERVGPVITYAICLPLGGLVLAVATRPAWPAAEAWPWLIGLAVGSTWLPYLALSAGLARVPSSRAVVVATLEPVVAATIAVTVYDERMAAVGWLGAVLIVVAATVSAARR